MNKKEHRRFLRFCVKHYPEQVEHSRKYHFFTEDKPRIHDRLSHFCLSSWDFTQKTWVSGFTGRWVEKEQQAMFEVIGFYRAERQLITGEPWILEKHAEYNTHHCSSVLKDWKRHIQEGENRFTKKIKNAIYAKLAEEQEIKMLDEWKECRFSKLKKAAVRRAPDSFFKLHAAAQAISTNTMK